MGVIQPGQVAKIQGRNSDSSWWYINNPNSNGSTCWIAANVVTVSGDPSGIVVINILTQLPSAIVTVGTPSLSANPSFTPSPSFTPVIIIPSVRSDVFAVIRVSYTMSTWSDSSRLNCPRVIAQITTNGAGTVTYTWTSNSGTNSPATLTFGYAGTQAINYDWALGHVWNGTTDWVGIFIDSPNQQDFGHIAFTTACTSP
jgi:hypothetical protein